MVRISPGNVLSGVLFAVLVAFALAVGALGSGGAVTPVRAGVATCPPWTPNPHTGRYPVEQRRDVELWYGTVAKAGDDITSVQMTDHITSTLQHGLVTHREDEPRLAGSEEWVVPGDNRTWILSAPEGLDAEDALREALSDAGGPGTQFDAPINQGTGKYVIASWVSTCDSANGFVQNEGAAYVTFYELNASAPGAGSPTATAPAPTATPGRQTEKWGDNNCDGDIDEDDMMRALIGVGAPEQVEDIPGCPDMGEVVALLSFESGGDVVPQGSGQLTGGDVDCTTVVDGLDALDVLLFTAELEIAPVDGFCPDISDNVTFLRQ